MAALTATGYGALGDNAPFHLPMPGLFADVDAGSGSVALTDEFMDAPPRARTAVLQQWIRELSLQRDAALVDMFREFSAPLKTLTIIEQIERFRHLCSRQGMECPAEFPVMLQRF
ncbi:MAG: hypothetical protein ABIV63_00925 [Caldimonas sp.]